MAFECREFVEFARLLVQTGADNEAAMRTAVSRAYFGAFCHAKRYAIAKLGYQPQGDADDHGRLRNQFRGKHGVIGDKLHRLRLWRNEADYPDETDDDWATLAIDSLREAEAILSRLPVV